MLSACGPTAYPLTEITGAGVTVLTAVPVCARLIFLVYVDQRQINGDYNQDVYDKEECEPRKRAFGPGRDLMFGCTLTFPWHTVATPYR